MINLNEYMKGKTFEDEEELCAYVDENGVRCRNHARPDSCFCGIHDGLDEE